MNTRTARRFRHWLFSTAAVFLMPAAPVAHAESFDVAVRLFCPASWDVAANRLDESFTTLADVPCAGIRGEKIGSDSTYFSNSAYDDDFRQSLRRSWPAFPATPSPVSRSMSFCVAKPASRTTTSHPRKPQAGRSSPRLCDPRCNPIDL